MNYQKAKEPDRNAPRYRTTKWRYDIINKELHQKFIDANPDVKISWLEFKEINKQINLQIIKETSDNREGVLLPANNGRLWLGLFPPSRRTLLETGEIAFNFETSSMKGKICWDFDLNRYRLKNYDFYAFMAHRKFKQVACRSFRETPERYMRINGLIRKFEYHKKRRLEENELNEFNNQVCDQSDKDSSQTS